jgi:carbonic anhydrase
MASNCIFRYAVLVLTVCYCNVGETFGAWSYDEVDKWPAVYPICGDQKQSPVDIPLAETDYNSSIGNLQYRNYDSIVDYTQFDIVNNGHTVQVTLQNVSKRIGIYDGGLSNNFSIEQFHFHWGSNNMVGSEHKVDGVAYPEELHIVHFNSDKYNNVSDAANHTDGLAVLGIFIQISDENNTAFQAVIENFKNIQYENFQITNIMRVPIRSFLPTSTTEYFRYQGSLTTPPCHQSVTWTVFRNPLTISAAQLLAFRTALFKNESGHEPEHLVDNYRTTLPLNGRNVTRSTMNTDILWTYETGAGSGPNAWKNLSPMCGWSSQSPISISTSTVEDIDLGAFTFQGFSALAKGTRMFNVTNTGHAVELTVGSGLNVSGGGLDGPYLLEKVAFHWGENNSFGSEHYIDGKSYALEIQFTFRSSRYSNTVNGKGYQFAILSTLAQVVDGGENSGIANITSKFSQIRYAGNETTINSFDLTVLLPNDMLTFYRYNGSWTSPNCSEGIAWTIFANPINISATQAEKFRTLYSDSTGLSLLTKNYRPVQPLNSRTVYRSLPIPETTTINGAQPGCSYCTLTFILLLLVMHFF